MDLCARFYLWAKFLDDDIGGGNDKLGADTKIVSRAGWDDHDGSSHAPGHVARCPAQASNAAPDQFACAIR
jgi:hypothetical protein